MGHQVRMKLSANLAGHKDIEIDVRESSRKLGTLLVSKGNIEWQPAWKSVKKHRLSWSKFAGLMEGEGRPVRSRR